MMSKPIASKYRGRAMVLDKWVQYSWHTCWRSVERSWFLWALILIGNTLRLHARLLETPLGQCSTKLNNYVGLMNNTCLWGLMMFWNMKNNTARIDAEGTNFQLSTAFHSTLLRWAYFMQVEFRTFSVELNYFTYTMNIYLFLDHIMLQTQRLYKITAKMTRPVNLGRSKPYL